MRPKFLIGGAVIVLALGYLGYQGFMASASYYYKVDEFLAQQSSLVDENVRISGVVTPGSVEQEGLKLNFAVTDGQQNLPVVYEGAVPDTFKAGREIVIEGQLNSEGIFVAKTLMPKCPSKYVPAT